MQPLVGRTEEIERVRALLEDAAGGRGGLVFFAGEAGIGKSRLAQQVEIEARQRGFRVAWGRCWEVGVAPAFWPWTQVFESLAVADPLAERHGTAEGDDRFRQLDRAARLLTNAASEGPLVLVLDDLHAADVPSLDLLLALARRLRTTRIVVVGAYRDAEARLGPTRALLAKIAREGEVRVLARLRADEVAAWLRLAAPDAAGELGAEVHRVTEGNPLFVHELLRIGKLGAVDARQLPDGLNAVLDEHCALVPQTTRELLAIATVLGREVTVEDVSALAGEATDRVEAAFRQASAAGLVEPVAGRVGRYAMTHVLLRDRLHAELPPSRRAALHWRAGERMSARSDVVSAAFHLLEGVGAGEPTRASEVAKDAATSAMARFAFEEAATLSSRALEALAGTAPNALVCELEILRAEARVRAGNAGAKEDCVRAARLSRQVGSRSLEARAALAYGAEVMTSEIDPAMVTLLSDALASLEGSAGDEAEGRLRARVLARLAAALTPPTAERLDDVRRMAREAVTLARSLGDTDTLVYATRFAMIALGYHVAREEYYEIVEEVTTLATKHDRPVALLDAAGWSMCTLREQGRRADAARALDAYERLAAEHPRPQYRWRLPLFRATAALLDGELDAAEWLGREARAIADQGDLRAADLGWAQHRVALAIVRDDPASIAPDADRILRTIESYPRIWAFTAWVLAAMGRTDEARVRLSERALDATEYPMLLVGAEAVRLLADAALAQRYYDALSALPGRIVMFWGGPAGTTALGPWERELAEMAMLIGRHEEARKLYDDAVRTAERLEAKPFIALAGRGRDRLALRRKSAPPSARVASTATLAHAGEHWRLDYEGRSHVLKTRKGLVYLAQLLHEPGREMHVLDLATSDPAERPSASDRGAPLLDRTAKDAYRGRLEDLRDALERAQAMADGARAAAAQAEIDALAAELARALGLGGRDRTTTTAADRARSAVTLAIRRAIDAVKELEPVLGGHLESAVETGAFCAYRPDPRAALRWDVTP